MHGRSNQGLNTEGKGFRRYEVIFGLAVPDLQTDICIDARVYSIFISKAVIFSNVVK